MRTLFLLVLLAVMLIGSLSFGDAPAATSPAAPEEFELRVKFNTPITPNYELKAIIAIDKPFLQKDSHEKGAFNVASGLLLPPVDGKYPLALTLIDWQADNANTMTATKEMLRLGESHAWGMSGGIIHLYTVTLTRVAPKLPAATQPATAPITAP